MEHALESTLDAVGPRLKHLRQRRDITLNDLAEETGISTSTLSRLEAGLRRPTLEQVLAQLRGQRRQRVDHRRVAAECALHQIAGRIPGRYRQHQCCKLFYRV